MKLRLMTACIGLCALFAATAHAQMTEGEKKAAARAAYLEGVTLQDANKPTEALAKFQAAQKLFDAPTHILHIAQCQEKLGRLVEASESYESLIRRNLGENPPDAFQQAQDQAGKDLPPLRERIPKLRITVKPDPSTLHNLYVSVNDKPMPNDVIGIQRPVNPGTYKIAASADGFATREATTINIVEKDVKAVELVLVQGAVAPVPIPPPYPGPGPGPAPPPDDPNKDKDKPRPPQPREGPSSLGLLVGPRLGAYVPGGDVAANAKIDQFVSAGVGAALDVSLRFAKLLLGGVTAEYVSLAKPDKFETQIPSGQKADFSGRSTYFGLLFGIVPNIDKVSFIGDIGLGRREVGRTVTNASTNAKTTDSYAGLEFAIGAGLSIPGGPIRIVPKAALSFGSFGSRECKAEGSTALVPCPAATTNVQSSGHTFFFVGVALYYHADLGKKPAVAASARRAPWL